MLTQPYKQEGNTQKCYRLITDTITADNEGVSATRIFRDLMDKVHEQFAENFKECNRVGHNAYYKFNIKVGIVGIDVPLTSRFLRSYEGSFDRVSRFKLFGASPKQTSLLVKGLDLAEEPLTKSARAVREKSISSLNC